jgi:hypothetical protein
LKISSYIRFRMNPLDFIIEEFYKILKGFGICLFFYKIGFGFSMILFVCILRLGL